MKRAKDNVLGPRGFGGGKRDRTADLVTASHALYQLSYTPQKIGTFDTGPKVEEL